MAKSTYKDAGVDLDLYRKSMAKLPHHLHRTFTPRVIGSTGGFAGLFQLDFANQLFARNYQDPVLVACTDGVGTKVKVAQQANRHDTVGIDLVAMSVNDAICCGAEPLFFLDYVGMSHDDPDRLEQIVRGIAEGCLMSDCSLLGGETAIMPDLYAPGDYDLAGFCVAVVERHALLDGTAIIPGDLILGLASSGLHSNGYSLARKVVFEQAGLGIEDEIKQLHANVGDVLLEPTRIYAKPVGNILSHYKVKHVVHGIAHITGGGLHENLERILPTGAHALIQRGSWTIPPVFPWIQELGDIDPDEMERVFNMGLGLVMVISPFYAESIRHQLADQGIASWTIGEIIDRPQGVSWKSE